MLNYLLLQMSKKTLSNIVIRNENLDNISSYCRYQISIIIIIQFGILVII